MTLRLIASTLLALFAATAASAQEDVYRCRVVGDLGACKRLPMPVAAEPVTQLVPGSYARYLINNGRPVEQAIAEARSIGEEPTLQLVKHYARRQISDREAYERYVRGGPSLADRHDGDVDLGALPVACVSAPSCNPE